ncbi:MAG: CoA transferase [Rhodospirillales bacterium]|nr:CoA transferase [Rhodospirillales bacterium]
MTLPLEGVRVLELARTVAGPFCSMTLADMGAEVIKIEEPSRGDETRGMAPFWKGEGAVYLAVNRNKKSVAVDLKSDAGREIVLRLAESCDVLIENFRTGTAERLGLGYAQVSARNPRIIYCSVSGFGRSGPIAHKAAYDFIMQGYAGVMSVTGTPDGEPVRIGYPSVDITAGLLAYGGIMTALWAREKTGRGQLVQSSLLAGQITTMTYFAVATQATGVSPKPMGHATGAVAPYQAFMAADRYFLLAVGNDGLWRRFCRAIDRSEWIDDPRYATNAARVAGRSELVSSLTDLFRARPAADWVDLMDEYGVPASLIQNIAEVLEDEQVRDQELVVSLPHPKIPELKVAGVPLKLSETPGRLSSPPPMLGEHTRETLREIGFDDRELDELAGKGVIRGLAEP